MATYGDESVDFKYNKIALKESYINASKDTNFKKLVARIKASDEIAMKYTSRLEETVKELNNCSKCKGLEHCKNKVKGSVYYPSVNGKMISFNYVACKYQKEYDELLEHSKETFEYSIKDLIETNAGNGLKSYIEALLCSEINDNFKYDFESANDYLDHYKKFLNDDNHFNQYDEYAVTLLK